MVIWLVNKNDLVWIHYTSKDSDNGDTIEPQTEEPILVSIGNNTFPQKLKEGLISMSKGEEKKIDIVVAVEARGFIVGGVLAYKLGAGFVPLRKPGKLPYKTIKETYEL